jgi:hypothetical protein
MITAFPVSWRRFTSMARLTLKHGLRSKLRHNSEEDDYERMLPRRRQVL